MVDVDNLEKITAELDNRSKYQSVAIRLSDDRVLRYTGAVQVTEEEISNGSVRVVSITITPPKDLPEGCFIDTL